MHYRWGDRGVEGDRDRRGHTVSRCDPARGLPLQLQESRAEGRVLQVGSSARPGCSSRLRRMATQLLCFISVNPQNPAGETPPPCG